MKIDYGLNSNLAFFNISEINANSNTSRHR